ncbi:MAG: ABC transporter substrate-binding protein [Firmicutes bacterium]|nr:ABC transporter substrate-binding protein [Bacillota bacterium]
MKRSVPIILILGLVLMLIGGCSPADQSSPASAPKGPVIVGSKIDTEGALLGQMIIAVLKANGFTVVDKTEFGPTNLIRKALLGGEIDIYPEYTGNGAFFFAGSDTSVWKDAAKGYAAIKKLDYDQNQVVWLQPAPANNTWAIAVRNDLAQAQKLVTMEDFAQYAKRSGQIKLAASEEFVNSPAALPAFQSAYDFNLKKEQLLTLSGGNTSQTEKAAADQTDGVNFAMAYGTDGSLAALGLVILQDTRGVQPVYEPAPIVRGAVYSKYPEMSLVLDPVFASLDLVTLQRLNAKIAVEGQQAAAVAGEYLRSQGFLKQ